MTASGDAPVTASVAAFFLDRDGTVIRDLGYVSDPADVTLLPGAAEAIARLNQAGIAVLMITNQSGIGRDLYTEDDFRKVQVEVERQLRAHGATLDGVYHCPHAPDAGCACRKPELELYRRAAAEHDVDPAGAVFVGDKPSDVLPAVRMGGRGWLLVSADAHDAGGAPPAARSHASAARSDAPGRGGATPPGAGGDEPGAPWRTAASLRQVVQWELDAAKGVGVPRAGDVRPGRTG